MFKKFIAVFFLTFALFRASANEGMWLPMLLGQQVYDDMVKHGLKLSKDQLYSINKPTIKDAIVIFGGGCTGEVVSNQGLIFTNHHCGYGAINAASSLEHNYLRDGFYAYSKDKEIQTGLSVTFLERIEDVTEQVEKQLQGLEGTERAQKTQQIFASIAEKVADPANGISGRVYSMFKGNQFLMYVYKVYRDIRLVGTPPESVGKFGGDSDNWEWPRHTGDFAVFRVYTSKDGKPATYSTDNVPLKPKWFLPVSLKGYSEGSYAMIYGYPGGTNRYEVSYGIKLKNEIENPTLVSLRDVRLKAMQPRMEKDPAVKLKLADTYSSIANYYKFYNGETEQLIKHGVYETKQGFETKFTQWAKDKPDYEQLMNEYAKNYEQWTPYSKSRVYLTEGILGSPLATFAASFMPLERALVQTGMKQSDVDKAMEGLIKAREGFIAKEDVPSDKIIMAKTAMMYYQNVDKDQQPTAFFQSLKSKYGSLDDAATYEKWAEDVFAHTIILNDDRWQAFIKNPDAVTLQEDPAYAYASAFVTNYNGKYASQYRNFMITNEDLGRRYLKGIMEMDPVKAKKMYPDANFSMRVSYGTVASYSPRDGMKYNYFTTSDGILEKYIAGDYEFDLPAKQIELLKKRDFGQYADKKHNALLINFISTNDITGGNSGSPIIDGEGNLIGLAFDGNYEALSHKLQFDKSLNRTISVDIRYVLWCIDKLGGAKNIIDELKLVR